MLRLICCVGLAAAGMCFAADEELCTLEKLRAQGADALLEKIAGVVPFDSRSFFLYESQARIVRGRAVSRLCNGNERWILYDPAWAESLKQKYGNSDLPFYFVLAHEAAHHVLGHTLLVQRDWDVDYWGPQQELAADETAAVWVTRALRPTKEELLRAFDSLGLPEQADPRAGYPSRAARRAKVVQGYEVESARNMPAPAKPPLAPVTGPAKAEPADPFRDALLKRIDEVRVSGRAETPMPGAIECGPNRCTLFRLGDRAQSDTGFRQLVQQVESALRGLGWARHNEIQISTETAVWFTNANLRVRVVFYSSFSNDVDVATERN